MRIRDQKLQVFDSYLPTHLRSGMSDRKGFGRNQMLPFSNSRLDKGAVDQR